MVIVVFSYHHCHYHLRHYAYSSSYNYDYDLLHHMLSLWIISHVYYDIVRLEDVDFVWLFTLTVLLTVAPCGLWGPIWCQLGCKTLTESISHSWLLVTWATHTWCLSHWPSFSQFLQVGQWQIKEKLLEYLKHTFKGHNSPCRPRGFMI